jgi:alcohol dehydrogenase class IV
MNAFVFETLPGRVVFGPNTLDQLPQEIEKLGAKRALVLSTPQRQGLAQDIANRLGDRCAGIFAGAVMHVPVEVAHAAREEADRLGADCVVAAGGGSTIGLGKAIALHSSLPILAIPTTYAGSEMTPIYGLTENGLKKTGRDQRVLPKTVIYDPNLTLDLPPGISVTSGFNAIAHAVEALYADQPNPITAIMAEDGIRALAWECRRLPETPGVSKAAASASTAPGSADRCWRPAAWRCTTSWATCWAEAGICRTPKPTPSSCRTWSPSTTPRRRGR